MSSEIDTPYENKMNVFDIFPFLQSFPFDEYSIKLEQGIDYLDDTGIDPIVLSAGGGGIAAPDFVNFAYIGRANRIILSFYTYDINFIVKNVNKIKKLDSIREIIDIGLKSKDLVNKINGIRVGEKFLKKMGNSLAVGHSFNKVFDDIIKHNNIHIKKEIIREIKLKQLKVAEHLFSDIELSIIRSFYNLHLHHIKVLLGVVISIKIY